MKLMLLIVGCLVLPGVSELFAQTGVMRICVVQMKEGTSPAQLDGRDAHELAQELVKHKLSNGTPIESAAIRRLNKQRDADATIEREGCAYVVELWRHESADQDQNDFGGQGGPQIPTMHDSNAVVFALTSAYGHKVILRGAAPPPTIYARQGHRRVTPWRMLSDSIVKKISGLK